MTTVSHKIEYINKDIEITLKIPKRDSCFENKITEMKNALKKLNSKGKL